jgi:hypothetical protein
MSNRNTAKLVIPGFGESEAFEAASRGYLSTGKVELPDGRRFAVVFYDITRLQQDLASEAEAGRPFLAEPGLVVVQEVTLENMQAAVDRLLREHYFDHLMPESRE